MNLKFQFQCSVTLNVENPFSKVFHKTFCGSHKNLHKNFHEDLDSMYRKYNSFFDLKTKRIFKMNSKILIFVFWNWF